jgi:hypothetical protein
MTQAIINDDSAAFDVAVRELDISKLHNKEPELSEQVENSRTSLIAKH